MSEAVDRARQAGAYIEVTPSMIEAGRFALGATEVVAWEDEATVLAGVYRAMALASHDSAGEPTRKSD